MPEGVELTGSKELNDALLAIARKVETDVNDTVNQFGLILTGNIKKEYHAHRSKGRTYRRGKTTHTASKSGFPPNTDTGRLASSVTFRSTGFAKAEVFSKIKYGAWLEFGTKNIKPRPLWRPERDKLAPKYVGALKAILEGLADAG